MEDWLEKTMKETLEYLEELHDEVGRLNGRIQEDYNESVQK